MDVISVKRAIINAVSDHLTKEDAPSDHSHVRSALDLTGHERGDKVETHLAEAIARRQTEKGRAKSRHLTELRNFRFTHANGHIGEGSLIHLKTRKGEELWMFVLSCCAGEDFHIDALGAPVTVVTTNAPVVKSAISARKGTYFTVNNASYRVLNVY